MPSFPLKKPFETPKIGDTVFSDGNPYLVVEKTKAAVKVVDSGGAEYDINIKNPVINGRSVMVEGLSVPSGIWADASKPKKKFRLTFAHLDLDFEEDDDVWAVYKGEIYEITDCSKDGVMIRKGKKEVLVKVTDIRVFIGEDDAKTFLRECEESWAGAEDELEKQQDILDLGFCKLIPDSVRKLPAGAAYLKSDYPNLFVTAKKSANDLQVLIPNIGDVPVDCLEVITKKEFDAGVKKEQELVTKRIIGNRILRAMEKEVKDKADSIISLQAKLVHRIREHSDFVKKVNSGDLDAAMNKFYEEVNSLNDYKNVEKIEIKDGVVVITTKDMFLRVEENNIVPKKNLPLNIGTYKIYIDLINNLMHMKQDKKPDYVIGLHSHVLGDNGSICMGTADTRAKKALADLDIVTVFEYICALIENVSRGHDWQTNRFLDLEKIKKLK